MSGELCNLHPGLVYSALELICICFTFRHFLQVNAAAVPCRYLNTNKAEFFCPPADTYYVIEGSGITHELGQEYARAFQSLHDSLILVLFNPVRCVLSIFLSIETTTQHYR